MKKINSTYIIRYMRHALLLCGLTAMASACSDMHEPLLHIKGTTAVQPQIEQDVSIDMMWEADWQAHWQVDWDTEAKGEIGYTAPESYHMNYFRSGESTPAGERDMMSGGIRLSLDYGNYDLLLYNNDYESLRIDHTDDWSNVTATTDSDPYAQPLPDSITPNGALRRMPEQLFSMYAKDVHVSDNLDDYEYLPDEGVYLLRINSELLPRTFIYLLQVELKNNNGRVTGCGSSTIDGLASSVNLLTAINGDTPIAHQFSSFYQEKTGEDGNPLCLIGGRMTTFGLCGISPWEEGKAAKEGEAAKNSKVADGTIRTLSRTDVTNTCYVLLHYSNGGQRYVRIDITEQMRGKLTGGVINITLDLNDYTDPKPNDGGFNADVDGWGEENHHTNV